MPKTNPIEAAVLPLKSEAIERAEKDARALIARLIAKLEANDWNLDAAVPVPTNVWDRDYKSSRSKQSLYRSITTYSKNQTTRSIRDPEFRERSPEAEDRFVETAKLVAAQQYEAFVGKLVVKVGPVKTAILRGSHVWGYSVLTVETAKGETQRWQTQQIVNQSKLGTLFNQWPTRKLGPKAKAAV